ncbi:MAG: D-alanyl-D-alanine carboxypeptidase/D-alanyl-D-alanine-endopeptidase [Firmicutes bacterium]|nr:D-alanyl-D-alanine carboxypeptidase/D-alanyl-D-alanine-endopeptidase [Bacillota bacterium]
MGFFRTRWGIGILVGLIVELALPHSRPIFLPERLGATTTVHASSIPDLTRRQAQTTGLQAQWQALARSPDLAASTVSATAYDITTHRLIAAIAPNTLVTPGSVMKLFTSAAALAVLGPRFRYQTRVMIPLGTGPSPIYLIGGGNPWLEANGRPDLEQLARTVARTVHEATNVEGYSAAYSPPLYGSGWSVGELDQNWAAATSALMAERSEITVGVTGNSQALHPPDIALVFNGPLTDPRYFTVVNRALTVAHLNVPTIRVTRVLGTNDILVTGRIGIDDSASPFVLSVGNPALFAANLFQRALTQAGVRFDRPAAVTTTLPTRGRTVAIAASPPLSQLLPLQNQYSINQMADNLYRALSLAKTGVGSAPLSQQIVNAFAKTAGISPDRVQVDGSGLSPLDAVSSSEVVTLLTYVAHQPWFATFRNSLIQLNNPDSCGFLCPPTWTLSMPQGTRVWVKPGNLANQWNLAGYVSTPTHQLIAFAILDDGTPTSVNATPHSAVQAMLKALANWHGSAPGTNPSSAAAPIPAVFEPVVHQLQQSGPGLNLALSVVNVKTGQTLYARHATTFMRSGLAPRLLLANVAMSQLGSTLPPIRVVAAGPVSHGVLAGSLILEGNDNNLTPADIRALGRLLKARGIRRTTGPLEYLNKDTGFNQSRWPSGLPWDDVGRGWAPPNAPLYYADDVATLRVEATEPGHPALTSLTPGTTGTTVYSTVTTVATGSPHIAVELPFHSTTWLVTGTIPEGDSFVRRVAPPDPGLYAASQCQALWSSEGLVIPATPRPVAAIPKGALVWAEVAGNSTGTLAQDLLTTASLAPANQLASSLGTTLSSAARTWLNRTPASVSDWEGASLDNDITCQGLTDILRRAFELFPHGPVTTLLRQGLWESSSPEQVEILGYVSGPHGQLDAVSLLASGLLWNHRWTPTIRWLHFSKNAGDETGRRESLARIRSW